MLEALLAGASWKQLAVVIGVSDQQVTIWRRRGVQVLSYQDKVARGVRIEPQYRLTPTVLDRKLAKFVTAANQARQEWVFNHARNVDRAALVGSQEVVEIKRQVLGKDGSIIDLEDRRVTIHPPDAGLSLKLLERRAPGWQPRQEITGAGGGPIRQELSVESTLRLIVSVQDGQPELPSADGVIDVEGEDVEDLLLAQLDELEEG